MIQQAASPAAFLLAAALLCAGLLPVLQCRPSDGGHPPDSAHPLVLAHRGLTEFAPENSIPAVKEAIARGADGCEVDVHLAATGEVVVLHDFAVDRVTDGKGLVKNLSLEQIKALRLKPDPGGRYPDETLPTLEELFQAVGKKPVLFLEMKRPRNMGETNDGLEEKVGALIDRFDRYATTYVSSFNPRSVAKTKKAWPEVRTVFEYHQGVEHGIPKPDWLAAAGDVFAVGPKVSAVTPELVEWAREKGYRLSTFSPVTLEEMELVAKLGFDIVQTHRPEIYRMVFEGIFEPEGLAGIPPRIAMEFEEPPTSPGMKPYVTRKDARDGQGAMAIPVAGAAGAYVDLPAEPETLYLVQFHLKVDRKQKVKGADTVTVLLERSGKGTAPGEFIAVDVKHLPEGEGITAVHKGPSYYHGPHKRIDEEGWMLVRFAFRSRHKTGSLRLLLGAVQFQGHLLLDHLTLRKLGTLD